MATVQNNQLAPRGGTATLAPLALLPQPAFGHQQLLFIYPFSEGERLKAVIGQLNKKQLTRGLPQPAPHKADASSGFAMTGEGGIVQLFRQKVKSIFKLKVESERLKAMAEPSKKQFTRGLPQPASHKADASGFAMTGEGGAVQLRSNPTSNDHSLTVNSALFYAVLMQKLKHCLCSIKTQRRLYSICLLFF